MAQQRMWSKTAEKRWRATFTRENREGARLLSYKMRNGATPASLVREEKAAHLAREAKEDNEVRRLSREMVWDAIPNPGAAKADLGFPVTQEGRIDWKVLAGSLLCKIGVHTWVDAHKIVMGRSYGMEVRCNRCSKPRA